MRQLPSGTVTFLFSDIEGSTRLLDELGPDAYASELAEHRRKMRDAFSAQGGVEVDTQGDAFFVAFPTASGALAAARDAQAALAEGPIHVRMGIHSGEPLLTEEGYVGIDVHRGARVMSAGHGGQVLISHSTQALVGSEFALRELGRHRLKDLTEPQPLYQLGDGDFPPPKSLSQTNLPVQPTPLIGRQEELDEVLSLLHTNRLVTLTGAGGSGKTRLAVQAAAEVVEDYPDGVWWVSLAALRDPELVEPTIAQAVGAKDSLGGHLSEKQALLVLDNFEQIVEAAPRISELLAMASGVRLLITSRERLALAGEQEYSVRTLVPNEAIALFTARARQIKPGFKPDEHVEEICRRLDGLPLAIELAAARSKLLMPEQIVARLGQSLDLLTTGGRDSVERHRTLRATIEWSYELLEPNEQELFTQIAVFAGSFDFDAAEAVCAASLDTLGALIDKSLLRQTDEGRFFMLETIREYGSERLRLSDEGPRLERRHADHYLAVAMAARDKVRVADPDTLNRLEQEHGNFRAALTRLLAAGDGVTALELAGVGLLYFWWAHGHIDEARRWIASGLEKGADAPAHVRASALDGASYFAFMQGDAESAKTAAEESLRLWRELGDEDGIARALNELGLAAAAETNYAEAKAYYREAAALDSARGQPSKAMVMLNIAEIELIEGKFDEATKLGADALATAEAADHKSGVLSAGVVLGHAALGRDDHDDAFIRFMAVLEQCRDLGFPDVAADALEGVAATLSAAGEMHLAVRLLGAAKRMRQELGGLVGIQYDHFGEVVGAARAQLGENTVERLLDEGRTLDLDDAIELTRASSTPSP